jgi:transcriptional/translational regulatory protein YebC/TACO1
MLKMSLALVVALGILTVEAAAQQQQYSGTKQEQDACSRDVNRYCRKIVEQGDMVILSCLQQNRQRLTSACRKVLADHGQ